METGDADLLCVETVGLSIELTGLGSNLYQFSNEDLAYDDLAKLSGPHTPWFVVPHKVPLPPVGGTFTFIVVSFFLVTGRRL